MTSVLKKSKFGARTRFSLYRVVSIHYGCWVVATDSEMAKKIFKTVVLYEARSSNDPYRVDDQTGEYLKNEGKDSLRKLLTGTRCGKVKGASIGQWEICPHTAISAM